MTRPTPIAVTGASGQLGNALCAILGTDALPLTRSEFGLATLSDDVEKGKQRLATLAPAAIIHCAAYTAVDKAESEPALAHRVNADATAIIAQQCAQANIPLVYLSTDYVFDGHGTTPWKEDDTPNPLNVYGHSKHAGEQAVLNSNANALIIRVSWVYDAFHVNFLTTMQRLGRERTLLRVVDDQIGAPGYAPHLAAAIVEMLDKANSMPVFPTGIYHLQHQGDVSWHGFAEAIFAQMKQHGEILAIEQVQGISTQDYGAPAPRPKNSRLHCDKIHQHFGIRLPQWQDGLEAAFAAQK